MRAGDVSRLERIRLCGPKRDKIFTLHDDGTEWRVEKIEGVGGETLEPVRPPAGVPDPEKEIAALSERIRNRPEVNAAGCHMLGLMSMWSPAGREVGDIERMLGPPTERGEGFIGYKLGDGGTSYYRWVMPVVDGKVTKADLRVPVGDRSPAWRWQSPDELTRSDPMWSGARTAGPVRSGAPPVSGALRRPDVEAAASLTEGVRREASDACVPGAVGWTAAAVAGAGGVMVGAACTWLALRSRRKRSL